MDNVHTITRRSLLRAAPAAAITMAAPILASTSPAIAEPLAGHATLEELAAAFKTEAMRIDPTITRVWSGKADLGAGDFHLQSIYLDRPTTPFVTRGKSEKHKPTLVENAIKAHKRAWDKFGETCPGADEVDPRYRGKEGEAAWERASRAEERALMKLLRLPAMGGEGTKRAGYLYDLSSRGQISLTEQQFNALLRSTAGVL